MNKIIIFTMLFISSLLASDNINNKYSKNLCFVYKNNQIKNTLENIEKIRAFKITFKTTLMGSNSKIINNTVSKN